jgi:hypothetical protein
VLDTWMNFDGTMGTQRECGAVDLSGGSYQVWCSGASAYGWARWDDVRANGSYVAQCGNTAMLMINSGGGGRCAWGNGGGNCTSRAAPYFEVDVNMTASATVEDQGDSASKAAYLYLMAYHQFETCMPMMAPTQGPQVVIGGVKLQWQ